ncbi:Protein goliath, partial [Pseudolycoriella hygida]
MSNEERGKYGEGRIFSVHGFLVHVTSRDDQFDHTGCDMRMVCSTGQPLPTDRPWIALIKRGGCNFEDKVKHAYEHKAIGVIVYNDRDNNALDKMKIVDTDRVITSVFTFKWYGEEMAKLIDEGKELNVTISEGRYAKVVTNLNRTSVLFVSVSFIVLMIISLVWLIFYYVQRFRYLQTKDRKSRQLCSVAKRIIAKIPTKNIKSDDKEIDNDCCAICIEPYKVTDLIRMLPCRHEFHKNCIDPWLLEHRTCPMCKMDILRHYGFVFTGSQESILQMDLDTEEGEPVGDENARGRGISPTFIIQLDNEHMRRSSVESVVSMQRGDAITNIESDEITKQKHSECSHAKRTTCEDDARCNEIRESISLPCTLRKCKGSDSCRGSNNCYVWAMDFGQLSKRMDKLEKGCPKSKTLCIDGKDSDNERLLPDRTYCSTDDISSPEHQSTSGNLPPRESPSIRSSSVCGDATTSQVDLK